MTWTEVLVPLLSMYVTRVISTTSDRKLTKSGRQGFSVEKKDAGYFKQKRI